MASSMTAYRRRAESALGRPLKRTEHVHHHSHSQLVICDVKYHAWLHAAMRQHNIRTERPLDYTIRKIDGELWKRVKSEAALEGVSVKHFIESTLHSRILTIDAARNREDVDARYNKRNAR